MLKKFVGKFLCVDVFFKYLKLMLVDVEVIELEGNSMNDYVIVVKKFVDVYLEKLKVWL